MKKTPLVLLAGTALLFPGAVIASPAAATSGPAITNCYKTQHGVQVRIRVRDMGQTMRVRVSHPDGTGNFREPRVRWTETSVSRESKAVPPDANGGEIGSAVSMDRVRNDPSFRTGAAWYRTDVSALFKLTNGKSIRLSCRVR